LESLVQEFTGVKALSLRHDISTVTGEEVVLFALAGSPAFRKPRRERPEESVAASAEIAAPLHLSVHTVETYRERIR
jgi:hypothetical protein